MQMLNEMQGEIRLIPGLIIIFKLFTCSFRKFPKNLYMRHNKALMTKALFLILILSSCCYAAFSHDVVIDVENMSGPNAAWLYFLLGFKHILPLGFDHILFVMSLFLLSPKLKPILWQSSAFTLAHSVTLGLAMYGVIKPAPAIVEPLIALSILYVALENIFSPQLKTSRILVVFLFGLVHGMGFAGVLQDLGLPEKSYLTSLIMFNVGVEAGQLTIILAAYFLIARWFVNPANYRKFVVVPLSVTIAFIAFFWTIQRVFY